MVPTPIFFNLTTSWWGSSVLIYRWDLKDSPSWHKECRKKWRHKLWKLDSLDLRKRGQYPPAHMGSWGRWIWLSGSGTSVPRRLLEMKWVPGRRTGSLTQIKLCNVLSLFPNPHPDFLLSPSVALVPSSLSQCSSVPTPPPSNPTLRCYSQVLGGKTKCLCPHFQNFYYLRSHLSSWKEGRP